MAKSSKSTVSDKRNRRAGRKSSAALPSSDDDIDDNDDDNDDNRSISTFSTASTLSYIQSILERRRQIFSSLPFVQEHDDAAQEGSLLFLKRDSSFKRASVGLHRTNNKSRQNNSKRRQQNKRKSQRRRSACFHPLVLFTLLALVSNWLTNQILNTMFIQDGDMENDIANYGEGRRGLGSLHDSMGEDISQSQYSDQLQRQQNDYDSYANNDYRHGNKIEAVAETNGNDQGSNYGFLSNQNKDAPSSVYGIDDAQTIQSSLTKRFVNLRQRLLSLYSEVVPSDETPSAFNNSLSEYNTNLQQQHPLFNAESPQYQALNWLSNIDKQRLRHYSPGLVQRYVLAVLYFSTGGPAVNEDTDLSQRHIGAWRNPTNFLAPTHECEWKSQIIDGAGRGGGIRRCDKNKTVVEISLYNELSGSIPSELGRLWNLRTLYLGRNHLTGTIPTELGMIQKLSSLSLQWNDLSGTIPNLNLLTLRALQVEGNEKLSGKVERHSLLCQMRNKYRGPTPRDQEKYTGRRVLRMFTATCIPTGSIGMSHRLECACCTECFGKTTKDLIYY